MIHNRFLDGLYFYAKQSIEDLDKEEKGPLFMRKNLVMTRIMMWCDLLEIS